MSLAAYLGVGLQPVPLPADLAPGGLLVVTIEKDSPAEKAGLVFADVLIAINGPPGKRHPRRSGIPDRRQYWKDSVADVILRGGKKIELALTVAEKSK